MDTTSKKSKLKYHLKLDEGNEMNESNKDENDQIVVAIKVSTKREKFSHNFHSVI